MGKTFMVSFIVLENILRWFNLHASIVAIDIVGCWSTFSIQKGD